MDLRRDRTAEVLCIMGNGTINQSYSKNTTNMIFCGCLHAAVCESVMLGVPGGALVVGVSELSRGSARSGCVLLPAGQISAAGSVLETHPHCTAVKLY